MPSKLFSKKIYAGAALIAVLLVVLWGSGLTQSRATPSSLNTPAISNSVNPASEIARWSARIAAVGGPQAYKEFLAAYSSAPPDTQHAAAHVMGHVLYLTLGIKGLPVCDSSFSFGCYHQFFTDALTNKGLSIIPELDQACIATYGPLGTGCQHGIGHGLVEYFGYQDSALLKELSMCRKTTVANEYFGCSSGVFMQYNEPIDLSGAVVATTFRTEDPKDIFAPCDTIVPPAFQKSCYFSLPQWWLGFSGHDFKQVGAQCAQAPAAYQESCFMGIGTVVAPSEKYNVADTLAICNGMPDQRANLLCRSSASWALFAMPAYRSHAAELCAGLDAADQKLCVQKSDLIGNGEIFKAEGVE